MLLLRCADHCIVDHKLVLFNSSILSDLRETDPGLLMNSESPHRLLTLVFSTSSAGTLWVGIWWGWFLFKGSFFNQSGLVYWSSNSCMSISWKHRFLSIVRLSWKEAFLNQYPRTPSWPKVFPIGTFLSVALCESRCIFAKIPSSSPSNFLSMLLIYAAFLLCSLGCYILFQSYFASLSSGCLYNVLISLPTCWLNFLSLFWNDLLCWLFCLNIFLVFLCFASIFWFISSICIVYFSCVVFSVNLKIFQRFSSVS